MGSNSLHHQVIGKIFRRLPSLVNLTLREQALMENPHAISLQSWAHMWKMDYLCGGGEIFSDLRNLQSLNDHAVIELLPNAEQTECFWQAWAEAEREIWS